MHCEERILLGLKKGYKCGKKGRFMHCEERILLGLKKGYKCGKKGPSAILYIKGAALAGQPARPRRPKKIQLSDIVSTVPH
jgi:hypothetical protein